ncbi:OmpP1/FadL family transporter [Sulfuriflexus sp.]|uniref:OmpP1/FadL family transporter n=1 Tax=Sulfuriflexus sp. TaxID=2015443 RepID=UPI0028CF974A|nr:outer membrane protein transport protein [Sulfuriflexus sp.]MDT8404277.1 outer membrane protein transport protein [Sulfuriflexus sp.]
MKSSKHLLAAAVAATFMVPMSASATNGYFGIGYGAKARGVAGATTAMPQDSMAAAVNPAGMAHVGERADLNVEVFSPVREAQSAFAKNNPNPALATGTNLNSDSGMNGFIIPSGGYVRNIDDQLTAGITIYANGGMNTFYDDDTVIGKNLFGSNGKLGVDLAQLVFAPTIAYKINESHTVGASLLVGYQRFKAYGLQNFCGLKGDGTCNPNTGAGVGSKAANAGLTNQGYDDAWGYGLRVGWQGKMSDNVTLGAAYSSKIYMGEFDKYDKLFAEQGDFDIPANWSIGIAAKVTPKTTVSFDIQQIDYSDVNSIANHGPTTSGANVFAEGQGFLGTNNGLGFGWDDMTIFKLGMVYEHDAHFTYRLGVSHTEQPIGNDEITFNILAPAVIEDHITAGFTYRPTGKDDNEINVAFMHALNNEERGDFPQAFGGSGPGTGESRIEMYQNAVEIGYSWKF